MYSSKSSRPQPANPVLDRMRSDGWGAVPDSPPYSEELPAKQDKEIEVEPARSHEGWKIWQRVVDATMEGAQGMATAVKGKINTEDRLCDSDEEDYSGGDTHLTRVMKEYYVNQSTSPADLPVWLFPDRQQHYTRVWAAAPTVPRSVSQRSVSSTGSYQEPARLPPPSSISRRKESPVPASHARMYSEHGSRTAQKLRQMKSTGNMSSSVS